jgi:ribosome-associated protein
VSEEGSTTQVTGENLPEGVQLAVDVIEDAKATGLLVLDVRGVASFTDIIIMCTGNSDRHVKAITDVVRDELIAEKVKPLHTEGYDQAAWVLVDFVDFLVNVFTPEARGFYQLDRVWRDAPVLAGERPDVPVDTDDEESSPEIAAEGVDG